MIIIGDIGGTSMRIAASDIPDSFEEPVVCRTPVTFDAALVAFAEAVRDVAHDRPITGGVLGIAGLLSPDRRTLLRAPHLQGWEGRPIADLFSRTIGATVHFENDAALGALGEARSGAGQGASIVAYVTVGTGIGGARVVDGHIDRTAFGFEIGHQRLGTDIHAPEWENLVGGAALEQKYGKPSSEINDPAIWNECADYFAQGLYNTILHWSPECVVLGGSLFTSNAIPLDRVRSSLRAVASALPEVPDLRIAAHGDYSGLYGALALATI